MAQTTEKDEKEIPGLTCAYFDALNGSILSRIQTGSDFSSDFPVEKPLEVTFTKKKKKKVSLGAPAGGSRGRRGFSARRPPLGLRNGANDWSPSRSKHTHGRTTRQTGRHKTH